jgi:beta-mannanase
VRTESAASYWPGSAYVDWVGTDFYSAFPNFAGLNAFYKEFAGKPFVFAEWAMWESDSASFVDEFFSWINAHRRVQMILYNEGYGASSQLLLAKYPAAIGAIRQNLASPRYVGYTSEWQPRTLGATGSSGVTGVTPAS